MATGSVVSPSAVKYNHWKALTDHLNEWFYEPDTEALELVLSATVAHYLIEADPIWLFIIGPAGSGKTAIHIKAANALPKTRMMGDLTPKTLLSGYRGCADPGLLQRLGPSAILLFKDFTTFLSKRQEDRLSITSHLREIYDGFFISDTGLGAQGTSSWSGKLTVIAACTPAVERAWAVMRELGERFVNIRLPQPDPAEIALAAGRQRGKEKWIAAEIQRLTLDFVDPPTLPAPPNLTDANLQRLAALSEVVARLRGHIIRDTVGKRDIIDFPTIEAPTRLFKSLALAATSHAVLFRRSDCSVGLSKVRRLALDSIPLSRLKVIQSLPPGSSISSTEVQKMLGVPESSLRWHLQELAALGTVKAIKNEVSETHLSYTDEFYELWKRAGLI